MLVLTFHGIGEPTRTVGDAERPFWITESQFAAVLDIARGRPEVRITFDDGNTSDALIALPLLIERDMKAEFFVLAGALDDPDHLSADQVRELSEAGMTIGSHGMEHRQWRKLDDEGIQREIFKAREILQELSGQPIHYAAAPFGIYDGRTVRAVRRAGFKRLYTSDGGVARENHWLATRHSFRRDDDLSVIDRLLAGEPFDTRLLRRSKMAVKRRRP